MTIDGWAGQRLENERVRCDLLPDLGGKIWAVYDKERGVEWVWHNPNVSLQRVTPSAAYDDVWAGGWDELFPNDAPGLFDDRALPDHGEWWNRPWQCRVTMTSADVVELELMAHGTVTPTRCVKRVRVERGSPTVKVAYDIYNLGPDPLRYLFKQHLAVAVTSAHQVQMPGGTVTPVDLEFSTRAASVGSSRWPFVRNTAGQSVDISLPPAANEAGREFVYVSELPAGWCGVRDLSNGAALRMQFDPLQFPYVWLFMTYGGWRDLHTVVLEPCTNMPKDLVMAAARGQCAVMPGYGTGHYDIAVQLS